MEDTSLIDDDRTAGWAVFRNPLNESLRLLRCALVLRAADDLDDLPSGRVCLVGDVGDRPWRLEQTNSLPRSETEVVLGIFQPEVVRVDIDGTC